eukprot:gnl/TRDRNA2_/TRDRNA2_184447_c0_seq1.p1 gnl/TRDRNA2_/TRDRNA2_184447_c0~~gnl/TRDRNA2_/TRDRNA2_184447_c0_seq1.p1  ORF type:complete len:365 (-),score=81.67 gnl/TRDRNA2_/TRDRNA2_184447_c0_seq1:91-1185(-)
MKVSAAILSGSAHLLLVFCLLRAVAAEQNQATAASGSQGSFWPFDTQVSFSLNSDDLPVPDWKKQQTEPPKLATIDISSIVPGEGAFVDESIKLPPSKQHLQESFVENEANVNSLMYREDQKVLGGQKGLSTLAMNRKAKAWVDSSGQEWATPESQDTDGPTFVGGKTNLPGESKKTEKFKDEYDVASDENTPDVTRDVAGHEQLTKEDAARQRMGDVETVKQQDRLRRAREQHMNVPISAAQQRQKVHKSAEQLNAEAGAAADEAIAEMPPGPAKQKAQCMAYANYLKANDIQGSELVKVWKLTCTPALDAGKGNPAYATMCGSMGSAVAKFAPKRLWKPGEVCDAVIKVFTESGLGAAPIQG